MADNVQNGFEIVKFLQKAVAIGASDVHLQVGERPALRVNGKILKVDMPVLTQENMVSTYTKLVPQHLQNKVETAFDLDFSYEIPGVARFRVNLNRQLGKRALVIRVIPYDIKNIAELKLPDIVEQFSDLNNGLVLITGPTGSGKSTTIASLIDGINASYPKHIVTIEDPIEFIFTNRKSIVSQRQVVVDTDSFLEGIKYALRQDPDVIFIGEIRDRETLHAALQAAETGHLVFATIHTNNAVQTVNRIVNMFETSDRDTVRGQLAQVLRGTISQKLVPLANGKGRQPACEVLVITPTVKDYIMKDKLQDIYGLAKRGSSVFDSIITMNMSLYNLFELGLITEETAVAYSDNKNELQQMLRGVYQGTRS
jgi:twitching motility protein PilT